MTSKQVIAMNSAHEKREKELGQECCLQRGCYREPAVGDYCEKHKSLAEMCARCGESIGPNDVTSGGCCYPCACDIEDGM